MNTTIQAIPLADTLTQFGTLFSSAQESYCHAGALYAKAIREHGDAARAAFANAYGNISASTWRRLEAIGNGSLDPRLLTASSIGASALRRLPAPQQTRALDDGVDLLLANGDTLRTPIDALTPAQARQVFAGDHVRDLAAQRAWMEANATIAKPMMVEAPSWQIKGGKVQVTRPCTLTRLDLARMLGEMG